LTQTSIEIVKKSRFSTNPVQQLNVQGKREYKQRHFLDVKQPMFANGKVVLNRS